MERTWNTPDLAAPRGAAATASAAAGGLTALFAAALLLGSGLIFLVEPMFAKMLLPMAGGSPAVWNTCLVFFQAALLVGYLYAHLTTRWLSLRQQVALHLCLVLLAAAVLPVAVPAGWEPPGDRTPIPWLLLALTAGLGAPFLVLSATAPLLQTWFARMDHPGARDPYHLYSASNAGSLLALLAYPLVVEPAWTLGEQSVTWAVGYGLYGACVLACAAAAVRYRSRPPAPSEPVASVAAAPAVGWAERGRWLALSLVPSSLLLGVTTFLSTDIAAVPLLWTVPLALYLLSFVMAFAQREVVPRRLVARAMPLLVTGVVVPMAAGSGVHILLIPIHLLVFFTCALRLHTALADRRPAAAHLTEFYLWIALGGVAGGLLNTFAAPLIFDDVSEYALALALACALQPRRAGDNGPALTRADLLVPAVIGLATIGASAAVRGQLIDLRLFTVLLALIGVGAFACARRPVRLGLALGALLIVTQALPATPDRELVADRTFFGVVRVRVDESTGRHVLLHGNTVHGQQWMAPERRDEPLAYYHREGPVGQLISALAPRLETGRIAVVGLGAGAMAAYAAPGQQWTFYEIDPAVARIAQDPAMFSYLARCADGCQVVLGDARLSLARTGASYDLLMLDAFSSDAIPVHLVTQQALDVYLSRLAPGGVLAFHISNRHLALRPVLSALADARGLAARVQLDQPTARQQAEGRSASEWLLMARDARDFASLSADPRWQTPRAPEGGRVWTDDFSDILGVLKPIW